MDNKINIDPELRGLIPPLSDEEYNQLEANIIQDGCRDPLVLWRDVLIDGHNRYEICTSNGVSYNTIQKEFSDRDEVIDWMERNQLGRRNLTPDQASILRGRIYNRRKKAKGGDRKSKCQSGPLIESTAETVAREMGVSERTIKRDAKFAEAAAKLGMASEIMSGEIDAPRKAIVEVAKALPEKPSIAQIEEAKKHVHVSANSGENEWYTPTKFLDAARAVMGSIDTDPASCPAANKNVKAGVYYTKDDNGLERKWNGAVWMNPPYAQPLIGQFSEAVSSKYETAEIDCACVLVNNATETKWFQRMLESASGVCFPSSRVKFIDKDGKPSGAPLQGQAIIYFGSKVDSFEAEFSQFGRVLRNE